jgi:uncharacterized membrane protein YqiK
MRLGAIILAVVLALGAFVGWNAVYTVSEVEQAIITQFGKPIGAPVTTAGLKLKVPFIQEVNPIDRRVLEWDGNPSDMPTKDKLYISSPAGASPTRCNTSSGCATSAAPSPASTTSSAARRATPWPSTN